MLFPAHASWFLASVSSLLEIHPSGKLMVFLPGSCLKALSSVKYLQVPSRLEMTICSPLCFPCGTDPLDCKPWQRRTRQLCVADRSQVILEVWDLFAGLRLFHNLVLAVWAEDWLPRCHQGLVSNSQSQAYQTHQIRICILTGSPGDLRAH